MKVYLLLTELEEKEKEIKQLKELINALLNQELTEEQLQLLKTIKEKEDDRGITKENRNSRV